MYIVYRSSRDMYIESTGIIKESCIYAYTPSHAGELSKLFPLNPYSMMTIERKRGTARFVDTEGSRSIIYRSQELYISNNN